MTVLDKLKSRYLEMHPYETPEFLVIEIKEGNSKYLEWIEEVTAE